jgi:hypothetical protein
MRITISTRVGYDKLEDAGQARPGPSLDAALALLNEQILFGIGNSNPAAQEIILTLARVGKLDVLNQLRNTFGLYGGRIDTVSVETERDIRSREHIFVFYFNITERGVAIPPAQASQVAALPSQVNAVPSQTNARSVEHTSGATFDPAQLRADNERMPSQQRRMRFKGR